MIDTTIRTAVQEDVTNLVANLTAAFKNDPFFNWLLRQDEKRAPGYDIFFSALLLKLCLPKGEVLITNDCLGGALWYPPGQSKVGIIRQIYFLPDMIRSAGWKGLSRIKSALNQLEKIHPTEKHYYLQFIGVSPYNQGKGLGTALIMPFLEKCDQEGCGAYLENSNEVNNDFYKKLGFEVLQEIKLGKEAPLVWPMWRSPR